MIKNLFLKKGLNCGLMTVEGYLQLHFSCEAFNPFPSLWGIHTPRPNTINEKWNRKRTRPLDPRLRTRKRLPGKSNRKYTDAEKVRVHTDTEGCVVLASINKQMGRLHYGLMISVEHDFLLWWCESGLLCSGVPQESNLGPFLFPI